MSVKIKIIFLSMISVAISACHSEQNTKTIGIIVPIEHKAMDEIVQGFKETVNAHTQEKVSFQVENAQADMNLERGIISQMKNAQTDLIVPIGTDASQMAIAAIHQQPIISLAASFDEKERQKTKPCHVAVVHDEISTEKLLAFIHAVYPNIQHITLIHSTSDKIFPEVEKIVSSAKKLNIEIKPLMVPTLNELYSASNNLGSNAQAILVLKDSLIVSGISTLHAAALKQKIPLITSDQGSVQDGATFALGVHEKEIGVEGGKLAAQILAGKNPCDLPIVEMTKLTVFVNRAMNTQQNLALIEAAAKKLHYTVEFVDVSSEKK